MSINTFGHLFRVTTWGESHGEAIGATIDGCPPGIEITQNYIQHFMEKRGIGDLEPGQGYQLKTNEAGTLNFLSNDNSYRLSAMEVTHNDLRHFEYIYYI